MTRPLRIEFEGAFYHVTSRGNERKKIFFTPRDYDKFKEYVAEARLKFGTTECRREWRIFNFLSLISCPSC